MGNVRASTRADLFGNSQNYFPKSSQFAGQHWIVSDYLHTWYNHVDRPNAPRDGALDGSLHENNYQQSASVSASSYHSGGVNLALADSSVRFVSLSIDIGVWSALATRAGNEIVTDF